jgi:hypothetical protein
MKAQRPPHARGELTTDRALDAVSIVPFARPSDAEAEKERVLGEEPPTHGRASRCYRVSANGEIRLL